MTVLSLAELEYVGDDRGADGLVKIAVRLREVALRASLAGEYGAEKLAVEVAQELEKYECEICETYKDDLEAAETGKRDAEDEAEKLKDEMYTLQDANSVLKDNVAELTEEVGRLQDVLNSAS